MEEIGEDTTQNQAQIPTASKPAIATAYYCQDFLWEHLRDEVEHEFRSKGLEAPSTSDCSISAESTIEAWEIFHKRHEKQSFFKERRYLVKEFPELLAAEKTLKVLEIGCGTGSSVLPVLRANSKALVFACDCSQSALKRAQGLVCNANPQAGKCQFVPFCCDICTESLPDWLCCNMCLKLKTRLDEAGQEASNKTTSNSILQRQDGSQYLKPHFKNNHSLIENGPAAGLPDLVNIDGEEGSCCVGGMNIVMMVFTLSSIPPFKMQHVIKECFSVLEPGGLILFRDYGLYDMTMRRFQTTQQLGDRLYKRGDGTLSYFFTPEVVRELFTKEGFVEEEISLCCVELKNRQKLLPMKRVWIHAKFLKPRTN